MNAITLADRATADTGFRPFQVIEKRPENRLVTSFVLRPLDPSDWRPFEPGQFLVLKVPGPAGQPVLRHYSISCDPAIERTYRITVKREAAPEPGFPDGAGSCYLHDRVDVGSTLEIGGPRGAFRLDRESRRPVVLLSGGVGLTPLVSMLHAVARDPGRRAVYVHACRDGTVHALSDEVAMVARRRPDFLVHTVYQSPTDADRAARRHDSEGFVTRSLLQRLLPLDDYDFYMCGPPAFMQAVYGLLRDLGVRKERIAYEFFGPATMLDPAAETAPSPRPEAPAEPIPTVGMGPSMSVTFARSNLTAPWTDGAGSLLDLAEANGLSPEFSCRSGVCGTCRARLVDGEVRYTEEPLDPLADGEVLLCCSHPVRSIVLDL